MSDPRTVANESTAIRVTTTKKKKIVRGLVLFLIFAVVGRVVGGWLYRAGHGEVISNGAQQAETATQKTAPSAQTQTPLPSLVQFLEKSRPLNPGVSDAALVSYWRANYGSKGAADGVAQLQKQADAGDPIAQDNLGMMYLEGEGVPKDPAKAAYWIQKSAAQGDAKAEHHLAGLYWLGLGVSKNVAKSMEWLKKAAAHGDTDAQVDLAGAYQGGKGVPMNHVKALEWYQKAAAQGSAFAQDWVATYYYFGSKGVPARPVEAVAWWQKAAAQGYGPAQDMLGHVYYDGKGVPKDDAKAFEWFQKAAAQGVPDAQAIVATSYDSGTGVQKDEVLAYAWINLVAVDKECASESCTKWVARWAKQNRKLRDLIGQKLNSTQIAEAQRLSSNWKPGQVLRRESQLATASGTPSGGSAATKTSAGNAP